MATDKILKVDPATLAFDHESNLSRARTPDQRTEDIKQRAIELYTSGQTQPVRCQGTAEKPGKVYIGTTRALAAQLIRAGFSYSPDPNDLDGEGKPKVVAVQDEKFLVDVVYDDISDEQAAVAGVADNFQADKPNDLDLAHAAKELKKRYGYTDTQITNVLHISDPNKVREVQKLLTLPKTIQDAVATGTLATSAALAPLKFEGDARTVAKEFLVANLAEGKAPTAGQVAKAGRDSTDPEAVKSSDGKTVPSGTHIRKFFEGLKNDLSGIDTGHVPDGYANFIGAINRWMAGNMKDETFQKKLDEAFDFDWDVAVAKAKKSGKGGKAKAKAAKGEATAVEATEPATV